MVRRTASAEFDDFSILITTLPVIHPKTENPKAQTLISQNGRPTDQSVGRPF